MTVVAAWPTDGVDICAVVTVHTRDLDGCGLTKGLCDVEAEGEVR